MQPSSELSTAKVVNLLNWAEAEGQQMMLVRNFDPTVRIDPKAKNVED